MIGKRKRHKRHLPEWLKELQRIFPLAYLDLRLWLRMPLAVMSTLIPPLGMTILLVVLSLTVTQEPVALVVQDQGQYARQMTEIISANNDAYALSITNSQDAQRMLQDEQIAAIITIPADFDKKVASHTATIQLTLNNVDIDFADDIRRSIDQSVGEFDAPLLGVSNNQAVGNGSDSATHNPYGINIAEHDLRQTNVDFLHYQVLPVLILLVLSTGLMGTALLSALDIERGTARHLALAPLSPWILICGRLLGGILICLVVLIPAVLLCLLTGTIAPPSNHLLPLFALLLAIALGAAGLGAVLGTIIRGTRNIALTASILSTYLFFMGGGFTTIAFLPQWLRTISNFNPIRYAIDGLRQTLFYPDLTGFSTDLGVLIGTAIVSALIGSIIVRRTFSK